MAESILLRPSEDGKNRIPYLSQENIQTFADVQIKSVTSEFCIKVNRIMLATLSDLLRPILKDLSTISDEEILIICELPSQELILLQKFICNGEWPENPGKTLISFGIDFEKKLNEGVTQVKIKNELVKVVKNEKESDFSDEYDFDIANFDLIQYNDESDSEFEPPLKRNRNGIKNHVENDLTGYPKFPSNLPVFPVKSMQRKQEKLRLYQEKYKDYVRIGEAPQFDKAGLLNYDLPQPIESYLKYARDGENKAIPKVSISFRFHELDFKFYSAFSAYINEQ